MEVTGNVHAILAEESNTAGTFKKRVLVVKTDEQYAQLIAIEFVQDKIDLIDPYVVGETVKVHINLRGREWVDPQGVTKYFNTIQGWRIERVGAPLAPHDSNNPTNKAPATQAPPAEGDSEHDDLPF